MRLHDERVAHALLIVDGIEDETFDFDAILAGVLHGFHAREEELFGEIIEEVGDLPWLPRSGHRPQVPGVGRTADGIEVRAR